MKTFIRFDENGNQIETTSLESKPDVDGWKLAPKDFDFGKRYRLLETGNIQEIPESELISTKLDTTKGLVGLELSRIIDLKRNKFIASSDAKRKCYEIQESAAKSVIADENSSLGGLIKPLADLRKISVLEMAKSESELDMLLSELSARLEDF